MHVKFVIALLFTLILMPVFCFQMKNTIAQVQSPPTSTYVQVSSLIDGLRLPVINATEDERVIVSLSYNGNLSSTPAVTLVVQALTLTDEDVSSFISSLLQKSTNGTMDTKTNQTSSTAQLSKSLQILTGSNIIQAGWKSPTDVSIVLQGNTTLNQINSLSVKAVPFTGSG